MSHRKMKPFKPFLPDISPTAMHLGKRAATILFEVRRGPAGVRSEVHLRKDELAHIIASAVDLAHRKWESIERLLADAERRIAVAKAKAATLP
jgi:hypothetical protein